MKTEPLDTQTRPHHPYSPSSLQSREACPCYKGISSESEASLAGTLQHKAAEEEVDDVQTLNDLQAFAVEDCLNYSKRIQSSYTKPIVLKELYLPVDNEKITDPETGTEFEGTTAGFMDLAVVAPDFSEGHIIDWKFGLWSVEPAKTNVQGHSYLLGLDLYVQKTYGKKLKRITVHFMLPHRDEVDTHTFERDEFTGLYIRIKTIVARATNEKRLPTPTLGTCVFCANLGHCEAAHRIILHVGKKYAPVLIPEDITPTTLNDPKEAGKGLKLASVVEAWAKAYKAQASRKSLEDDFIPNGYELVSVKKREVIDLKKLREAAGEFLTVDEIDMATKIHLTPMEKIISAKAPRGSKEAAVDIFSEHLLNAGAIEFKPQTAYLKQIKT